MNTEQDSQNKQDEETPGPIEAGFNFVVWLVGVVLFLLFLYGLLFKGGLENILHSL